VNRTTLIKAIRSPALALALIIAFAGTALATPALNFASMLLGRGTLSESVKFNTGEVKFQTKGSVDLVTNRVTIGPNGSSGWHAHPGVTLVTVAEGTVVHYDADCARTVYPTGTAFVESGDHPLLVRNESATTPAVNIVTFVVPAGTTALRIDKPNPGCPQN
jgi:quercetin dioxygenase-like cupin family protein